MLDAREAPQEVGGNRHLGVQRVANDELPHELASHGWHVVDRPRRVLGAHLQKRSQPQRFDGAVQIHIAISANDSQGGLGKAGRKLADKEENKNRLVVATQVIDRASEQSLE